MPQSRHSSEEHVEHEHEAEHHEASHGSSRGATQSPPKKTSGGGSKAKHAPKIHITWPPPGTAYTIGTRVDLSAEFFAAPGEHIGVFRTVYHKGHVIFDDAQQLGLDSDGHGTTTMLTPPIEAGTYAVHYRASSASGEVSPLKVLTFSGAKGF